MRDTSRFIAEHRAIIAQCHWLREWGDMAAGPATTVSRWQLTNMVSDLKQGLEFHYSTEEVVLELAGPEVAQNIRQKHGEVLRQLGQVENIIRGDSNQSAGPTISQSIRRIASMIESHNGLEDRVYQSAGALTRWQQPAAGLLCLS